MERGVVDRAYYLSLAFTVTRTPWRAVGMPGEMQELRSRRVSDR